MSDDPFETVVIAYTQPQASVLLSLFAWHGIPAYAMNLEMVRASCPLTLALGGIPIRVHRDALDDARALLAEAEARPDETVPATPVERAGSGAMALLCFLLAGAAPPPRVGATLL